MKFKENKDKKDNFAQNQRQLKYLGHNDERGFGESETHKAYRKQERQMKGLNNLPKELINQDLREIPKRYIKNYKGKKVVESYYLPRPEGTRP